MKKGKLKNRVVAVVLSLSMALGTASFLTACSQQKEPDPTPGTTVVTPVDPTPTPTPEPTPTPVVEKVLASSIYDSAFDGVDFTNNYVDAFTSAIEQKYSISSLDNLNLAEIEFDRNGKVVFTFEKYDDTTKRYEEDSLTFIGDTTGMETFYNMSQSTAEVVNNVLTKNGVAENTQVEKDSDLYDALVNDFALLRAEYDSGKTAFSTMSFDKNAEAEYVSVSSIVDEIFADIDVDADLKNIAQHILDVRYTTGPILKKVYAVDFDKENNKLCFVHYRGLDNSKTLGKSSISLDMKSNAEFVNLVEDKESAIKSVLSENETSLDSQVKKNSSFEQDIRNDLTTLKNKYLEQKTNLLNENDKSNVSCSYLYERIKDLTSDRKYEGDEEFIELGIELNDLAKALVTNTKGTGYDNVTGWTADDIIATYSQGQPPEGWDNTTGYNEVTLCVLTTKGVKSYVVGLRSYIEPNPYGLVINDSEKVESVTETNIYTYSDNTIVYDANGERIEISQDNTKTK